MLIYKRMHKECIDMSVIGIAVRTETGRLLCSTISGSFVVVKVA